MENQKFSLYSKYSLGKELLTFDSISFYNSVVTGTLATKNMLSIDSLEYSLRMDSINGYCKNISVVGDISHLGLEKNVSIKSTLSLELDTVTLPFGTVYTDAKLSNRIRIHGLLSLKQSNLEIDNLVDITSNRSRFDNISLSGVEVHFPFSQKISFDTSSILISNVKSSNQVDISDNFSVDSLQYLLKYDKIFLTDVSGNLIYDNLSLNLQRIDGFIMGGNFSSYVDFYFDKRLSFAFSELKDMEIANLLDSSNVDIGVEAKRLDASILNGEVHLNDEDYQININSVNSLKILKGQSLFNNNINLTKLGSEASIIVNDKLYQYTKDNNIKLLSTGLWLGYGLNRLNINVVDNRLNSTVYLRNDASKIIPFLVRIEPLKYKIINSFPFTDIGLLNNTFLFDKKLIEKE